MDFDVGLVAVEGVALAGGGGCAVGGGVGKQEFVFHVELMELIELMEFERGLGVVDNETKVDYLERRTLSGGPLCYFLNTNVMPSSET